MASRSTRPSRFGFVTLLVRSALPLALAAACGPSFVPADSGEDAAGSGGASSGGASSDGSGGALDGNSSGGGENATGGHMATDAPEFTGGTTQSGGTDGGGGDGGQSGPCYDEPCEGSCVGNCDDGFTCDDDGPPEICAQAFTTFCGCDGVSFTLPS